ncbi:fumarylacetoacetate hydrolase family protein [Streptomyces sp. NPDC091215]|uniref:fumarylacetoacetate hydrolase family protein n=1 Tax=Streptomyces sp. NPDC091215 TaxID=3155192 RepID=UPI00343BA9CB
MRLATIRHQGASVTAVDSGDGVWRTTRTPLLELVQGAPLRCEGGPLEVGPGNLLAPYRPPTIFGIGLNYRDTVEEMGWQLPEQPYLFPKLSSSVTGPYDPVEVDPAVTTRADWEAEIAVVIGRRMRRVAPEQALAGVYGYMAANDVSARDLQAADGQWVRGKGLDTFCPLGPWLVTADEIPDPQDLAIRTWYDGVLVQNGSSKSMIFGVAELVAYCSRWFTLSPGDVILTGTPAGCGDFRTPRLALLPGGTVEIEIDRLGRQRNVVVAPG